MKGFERPNFIVLPENSIVPDENLITPPPNQFTHELTRREPYYFSGPQQSLPQDGDLSEGTPVVLMVYDGGGYCRIIDKRGLYVIVAYDSLRRI